MLDYKGIGIASVWVVCASMVPVIMLRGGIEFSSILILLGIACGMTVVILRIGGNGGVKRVDGLNDEISELRSTVVEMNERIEKLTKILEE